MDKTKKSKKLYFTIIKYPYNEYLQTIITIRIQLGWVKQKEGWFIFLWIFTRNMFSINYYVLEVQYFCQWLHYDNL